MNSNKSYIGDSVYADFNGFEVILTTENGLGPTNTIVMEPQVFLALFEYVRRVMPPIEDKIPYP